jgi:5-enolpyruvylshikimate-3-phosphate synthase
MLNAPKTLPSRDLLPLATTVERVYEATPTWAVAALLAVGLIILAAVGTTRQAESDREQCAALYGADNARCAQ